MAKRGRPKKSTTETTVPVKIDHAKLLKQFEQEQKLQLESLYKDLANIKSKIGTALTYIGFMDECETIAQSIFKAGRAYGPLDQANDKLEEILDSIYSDTDLEHWDDLLDNL
jgi:hypothetical protein